MKEFIFFLSTRFIMSKGRDKISSVLSIVGIAIGVAALISVLSIMNGLQLGFIEDILEINSYHLRIGQQLTAEQTSALESVKGVDVIITFADTQALTMVKNYGAKPIVVRGIEPDFFNKDPKMSWQMNLIQGDGALKSGEIIIGDELAFSLGLFTGDRITLAFLQGNSIRSMSTREETFTISGVFQSGYYTYDVGFCLIPLNDLFSIDPRIDPVTGIKISNRFRDQAVMRLINTEVDDQLEIISWREYNRSFFGALRMEKIAMMVIISLIFLVVGLNIYNSQKRNVFEKKEALSVLMALGSSRKDIQRIFLLDGIIIGMLGAGAGLGLGLLLVSHLNEVIQTIETVFFSGGNLFIENIPVRTNLREVVYICLFGFISAVGAAVMAARKVLQFNPAEIMRYA